MLPPTPPPPAADPNDFVPTPAEGASMTVPINLNLPGVRTSVYQALGDFRVEDAASPPVPPPCLPPKPSMNQKRLRGMIGLEDANQQGVEPNSASDSDLLGSLANIDTAAADAFLELAVADLESSVSPGPGMIYGSSAAFI